MDSVFSFSLQHSSWTIPEHFRSSEELKTEKLFFPETSRKRFSSGFSFSVFAHYKKVPEHVRSSKNWKLKNCFFQRHPGRDSPYRFSFSVLQFYSRIGQEQLNNYSFVKSLFITCHLCIYIYIWCPPKKVPKSSGLNVREILYINATDNPLFMYET